MKKLYWNYDEKHWSQKNDFEKLRKLLIYIRNNLIYSDNNMYLTDINNIITGSNGITLRKVNVKWYGYDKIYIDNYLIEDKLYKLIDQLNERKINQLELWFAILDNIHPFHYGNGRTCKTLFVTNFN